MESIWKILHVVTEVIKGVAAVVLLSGVALAIRGLIVPLFSKTKRKLIQYQILLIKMELGRYILLGLEFLIVADIFDSIIDPTWQGILQLASIVAIRTVISFFLILEIRETTEELVAEEHIIEDMREEERRVTRERRQTPDRRKEDR